MLFNPPLPLPSPENVQTLTYDELVEHSRLAKANVEKYQHVRALLREELEARTPEKDFVCMKCGHRHFEPHEIRASEGGLSSLFGVESAKYRALVCQRCKFTEFYQGSVHVAQQALDFLLGG